MLQRFLTDKRKAGIARVMLCILTAELVLPNISYALSSGPVQPEITSFEPVGTTDMVDLFTGDFVYNIPLMDVEGYPINIAYHGGVTMDQEASWVGLGWNITPGAVNRGVRGLPDEFAGDTIEKEMNIRPEITKKIGAEAGVELAGLGKPILNVGLGLGGYITISNYRGIGVDLTTSAGVNTDLKFISAGVNVGATVGSQTGAAINYGATVGTGISRSVSDDMSASGGFNAGLSGVYSPRTGHRASLGVNVGAGIKQTSTGNHANFSTGANVPIGLMQNFSAVLTNPCYMNSYSGQLKVGGEVYSVYLNAKVNGSYSKIQYESNGSRKGYGYYNLDKSTDNDILDFAREKDGNYNTTMGLLPQSHLTYDVYNVSGQGTGGSFRPYRNDIGSVFDPFTKNPQITGDNGTIEVGIGNLFEIGGEYSNARTDVESGPWDDYKRKFSKDTLAYSEPLYFKEAGELTQNNESYMDAYGREDVVKPDDVANIPLTKPGAGSRVVRANHIYTHKGYDYDTAALVDSRSLVSYTSTNGFAGYPNVSRELIARVDQDPSRKLKRTPNQVTEIVQNQKDGRRYVYGLPVLNNVQREVTFAADQAKANKQRYLVKYSPGNEDTKDRNHNGLDNFYSSTVTPTYVAAHLLTSVLSKDYVDVTGNGISDDDLGSYTRFNYTRKSADYRWRSPIQSDSAQYIPAYISDKRDDKASYVVGSREQWMLHSVETRNYVAEFYVSPREDAKGVKDKILNNGPVYRDAQYSANGTDHDNLSYKLDSVVLYNKHDRFINGAAAQPIKAVLFSYDYSLCQKIPNATSGHGKLTLKKIRIRYGHSNLNLSAGYSFNYGSGGTMDNPDYNPSERDRWGFYKKNDTNCNNFEFPYTAQEPATNDYAKAWSLSEIGLPSGGVVKVDYEADDYAYVQDQPAMEMFKVAGMGSSPAYQDGANQLYFNINQQNLYFYFKRRKDAENPNLTLRENYLNGTNILYYNIPVELADGKYEPIKGYAEVTDIGICDGYGGSDYGYVKLSPRKLEGNSYLVNPVVYTALNVGRYSLPHILFPGSDPESTDMDNVTAGLKGAIKEMWGIYKNPLKHLIDEGKAQETQLAKAYVRLTSPGLAKKGGGQRVKSVKFYDNWSSMTGGQQAVYGKQYDYTLQREDGKGTISSGVASYEPLTGGDELPQRLPADTFQVQRGSNFPPNDPVELYAEGPICEGFYPGPVVGYRRVTEHSINIDLGRSSQTEDVHTFFTAKEFPIRTHRSAIDQEGGQTSVSMTSIDMKATAKQGFSVVLNDMHGKARSIEHWVLKPTGVPGAKELVHSQQFDYITRNGLLDNTVPTFSYNGPNGQIGVVNHTMGIESDLTIDSRRREEETHKYDVSASVNGFIVLVAPVVIGLGFPFELGNKLSFKSATVTKVTQQYGILNQVTTNNQGAITVTKNEVFDPQTGNALVTSVNNQYGDREYTVNYPAHWAYKELGPSYENQDLTGTFTNPVILDSLGVDYATRLVNYNSSFSTRYTIPSSMPVLRTIIDEEMPKFKLGDELLLEKTTDMGTPSAPVKAWVMGYTSDVDHCYLILATREPYTQSFYPIEPNDIKVRYRVARSGNKNRLGEVIQTYTTTDARNIFPYLNDTLKNLITLNATTYKHSLNQVSAANTTSDSLNPFITGKVGVYRPELQVVNLKKREYMGGTTRDAGTYNSMAYWRTEKDKMSGYCDSQVSVCPCEIDSMRITKIGTDDAKIVFYPSKDSACSNSPYYSNSRHVFSVEFPIANTVIYEQSVAGVSDSFTYHFPNSFLSVPNPNTRFYLQLTANSCKMWFYLSYDGNRFSIEKGPSGNNAPISYDFFSNRSAGNSSFKIRKKITLGKVGHYTGEDNENWRNAQQVTKYNAYGEELENLDPGIGYNSAVYGYNQQLPICVAKNARHGEVLYESFDDYDVLQPKPDKYESYMKLAYSPFAALFLPAAYGTAYNKLGAAGTVVNGSNTNTMSRSNAEAHTGNYSLYINPGSTTTFFGLNDLGRDMARGYSFGMQKGKRYVVSVWAKAATPPTIKITADTGATGFTLAHIEKTLAAKSPVIDGWQQYETEIDIPANLDYKRFALLLLGGGTYYDDIRVYPFNSNSKGFVYHPVTRKLMATLDENNYATFYEYDSEGNLVRTKKETDKGILTITESRSTHYKANP